jgi:signal transduction histidine kinase
MWEPGTKRYIDIFSEKTQSLALGFRPFFLIFFLLISFDQVVARSKPVSSQGILDLRDWDFEEDGPLELRGEWALYWQQFLDSHLIDGIKPSTYINSPGMWRQGELYGKEIPRIGYGTMRLKVLLGSRPHNLMLNIPDIRTSYELEVNGKIKARRGVIGQNQQTSLAQFGIQSPIIYSDTSTLDIIVRISDFERGSGGILVPITMGTMEDVLFENRMESLQEWFLVGVLFFSFLYHIGLYVMRRKDKFMLYFGLFSLAFVLRLLTRGQKFLFDVFPIEWWMIFNRIEFISFFVLPALYLVYFNSLFKRSIDPRIIRVALIITSLQILSTLFVPFYWHSYVLPVYQFFGAAVAFYTLFISFRLFRGGNRLAQIFFIGHLILVVGIVNDILHFNFIARGMEVLGYSSMVFLFIQIYALARRSTLAINSSEDLSVSLEEKVYQRTEQLSKANIVKGKLLSIISHDLRSPLASLSGFLNVMNNGGISKKEQKTLLEKLKSSIDESTSLLDSLLNWASKQLESTQLGMNLEWVNLYDASKESIEQFGTRTEEKNILIKNFIGPDSEAVADRNMLKSVIRNLLANAIKFTPEGGVIRISSKKEDNKMVISVTDSGIGLPEKLRSSLFDLNLARSRMGTRSEKGAGIGLILCKDFVNQMGGEIWVEDRNNGVHGSIFSFSLPLKLELQAQ